MESIQEQALRQRDERLKRLMQSQSNHQSLVQDAGATKIMPTELYNSAKTDNADGFLNKLADYSSNNKLHVTIILEKVTPCGDSLLHVAAAATMPDNSYNITKLLAPNFPDLIPKENFQGDTPLHLAAKTGKLEATKALIHQAKSSNIPELLELRNKKGNTALHEAVIHHHFQVVDCLIKEDSLLSTYQNREHKTPLYLAVETCDVKAADHIKILECLLQAQPVDEVSLSQLQKRSPAHAAVDKAGQPLVSNSLSKLSPTLSAIEKTNLLVILQKIAELKPQLLRVIDEKGELPLHYAASRGNISMVETLVQKFSDGVIQPNKEGLYPIHVACRNGQVDVVQLLLKQWPNPLDFVNANGKNILHIAAEKGQERVVKFILQYAANGSEYKDLVNATDLDGNTPLHLAAKNGRSMALFTLVRNPLVQRYAVNGENLTSYGIAQKQSKQAEVEYANSKPNDSTDENSDEEKKQTTSTIKSPQENTDIKKKEVAAEESIRNTDHKKKQAAEVDSRSQTKDMEVDIAGTPDNERKNKTSPKVDFYGAMMTLSILFFHAGPKSNFIDYLRIKGKPLPNEELKSRIETLLVVAVLVAGVTFAGALTIPKEPVTEGTTVVSKQESILKQVFIYFDMVSLNASVMAAIILCWAQLYDVKIANHTVWMASILIGGSIYLMCLAFLFGLVIQVSTNMTIFVVIIVVQGLLFICQTVVCIPLIIPPSANQIFERIFLPYVYYMIFCFYFMFQRILEVLGRHSKKQKTKQVTEEK